MGFHINLIGLKNLGGEIYRQVRQAIADGRLRPGDCLPASRDLARSLKVSRTTVTVAYDRLAGEGFVSTRVGAGTGAACANSCLACPRRLGETRVLIRESKSRLRRHRDGLEPDA